MTRPAAIAAVQRVASVDRWAYAMKANWHPAILRRVVAAGLMLECVSRGELEHAFASVPGLVPDRVLFTPNFAPRSEYAYGLSRGVHVTLDNVYPLKQWPELFRGQEIFLRIDPGFGRGHHQHVRTAGVHSKFGVPVTEVDELVALVRSAGARVAGLHAHAGSGIFSVANWTQLKGKGDVRYVGIATGMNSLIRPALYGAHHDIRNLTRLDEPLSQRVNVVGPICETADQLGADRWLPPTEEGDVLLIANCGAYGFSMASNYNLRPPAAEFMIETT
jgi:diaminopimelate decarboxylase